MHSLRIFLVLALVLGMAGAAGTAFADNVALNKAVTLNGTFFTNAGGWTLTPPNNGSAASVVDGNSFPQDPPGQPPTGVQTQWNDGTVWWNQTDNPNNYITIDLGVVCEITGFKVQGDVNDTYRISYWDADTSSWLMAYDAGPMEMPPYWGMTTRPQYDLISPIYTDQLQVTNVAGDEYVSVSEVQAYGDPVPLPGAVWLLGSGLGLLAWRRRRS